jgi:hypothetical protein
MQTGEQLTPEFAQLWLQHRQQHVVEAKQSKDPQAPMYQKQQNQMVQMLQKMMQQGAPPTSPGVMQASGAQAGGGMPPMGAPQPQLGAPPAQGAPGGQQNQAPQVAQALASLMKAGAHVDVTDVNAALVKMGLPPLAHEVAPPSQSLNTAKAIADAAKPEPKPMGVNPVRKT